MTTSATLLDGALRAAGIPIDGVSVGDPVDRATWVVHFSETATPAHQAAAATIVQTVVVDAAAQLDADVLASMDVKDLKAILLAVWEAIPAPLLTRVQLRARALAIRKGL